MRPEVTFAAIATCVCALAWSCAGEGPTDDTPDGALQLFLDSVNPTKREFDRELAYKLLAPDTQRELTKRAALASKQGKRTFEPQDMLVIERYVQRWQIKRMESDVQGDRAKVTAHGDEASQTAIVDLERVDGHWRVVLPLD